MIDDKAPPRGTVPAQGTGPQQAEQRLQPDEPGASDQQKPRVSPPRKPLFRH